MGETRSLQSLITVKGEKGGGNVVQPVPGWGQSKGYADGVFHVHILALEASSGVPKLALESAASPTGPWWEISSWNTPGNVPVNDVIGVSTTAPAFDTSPNYLERYFRWKIDVSGLTSATDTFALCFGICVTLK